MLSGRHFPVVFKCEALKQADIAEPARAGEVSAFRPGCGYLATRQNDLHKIPYIQGQAYG